jgi:hypothetical protein
VFIRIGDYCKFSIVRIPLFASLGVACLVPANETKFALEDARPMAATISPLAPTSFSVLPEFGGVRFADIGWSQKDHRRSGLTAIGKMVRIRETTAKTNTGESRLTSYFSSFELNFAATGNPLEQQYVRRP